MKEDTAALLTRSARAVRGAQILLDASEPAIAAGRAYYAMFYAAQALLGEQGFTFKTHTAVHGLFGRHFAKTGVLEPEYHRWLIDAFNLRLQGDYNVNPEITSEMAVELIGRAREFLAVARRFLGVAGEGEGAS